MKDLFDILVSLPTPLIRGTRKVLCGALGIEVAFFAWMVVAMQLLEAMAHATGLVSGTLIFASLLLAASLAVLTAFMTAGGNEYEPNSAKVRRKMGLLLSMMFNACLTGTVVGAVLVGLIALVGFVDAPMTLLLTVALDSAVIAVFVDYLVRKKAK